MHNLEKRDGKDGSEVKNRVVREVKPETMARRFLCQQIVVPAIVRCVDEMFLEDVQSLVEHKASKIDNDDVKSKA